MINEISRNTLDIMRLDREIKRLRKLIETSCGSTECYKEDSEVKFLRFKLRRLEKKVNKLNGFDKIISEDTEDDKQ